MTFAQAEIAGYPVHRVSFSEGQVMQHAAIDRVQSGAERAVTLALEFEPVLTLGRRAALSDILSDQKVLRSLGIEIQRVDRAGGVTFHNPGQLVVYPIWNLRRLRIGVRRFTELWLTAIAAVLRAEGVAADISLNPAGVWCNGRKIAFCGLRVADGISTHGFAINLRNKLDVFSLFVPCGLPGLEVTSLNIENPAGTLSAEGFFTRVYQLIQNEIYLGA